MSLSFIAGLYLAPSFMLGVLLALGTAEGYLAPKPASGSFSCRVSFSPPIIILRRVVFDKKMRMV